MPAVVVVGAQWGDEGKGKIIDRLAAAADTVVRFAGGPNAGHTLVVGDEKLVVRLIPSGALQPNVRCVLGQGMVIDLAVLHKEVESLRAKGRLTKGLIVSDKAHLILPVHSAIDALREGGNFAIGTTKRGVGPCYEDKAARRGIRLGDLRELSSLEKKMDRVVAYWGPQLEAGKMGVPTVGAMLDEIRGFRDAVLPLLADTSALVWQALRSGEKVLLEGAQGALLDLDHGTYPYVTSSSAVAGGACTGAGIGPTEIRSVVGIAKAYTTRVGSGPFPTELFDKVGEQIRTVGGEFGSVTGRPRRTGWIDLPALRYATRINGLTEIAMTKLDVLSGLSEIYAATAYEIAGKTVEDANIDDLEAAKPVLQAFPGWGDLSKVRSRADLPKEVRDYLSFIENYVGCRISMLGVGPSREATFGSFDVFG